MKRKININISEHQKLYRPTFFALLDSLTQARATKGEVLIMNVHDASILCDASLEESKGNSDKMVFCSNRVLNVDFIGVETDEGHGYFETEGLGTLPIEVIMPVISYLAFGENGYQPTDILEWDGSSITLEDAFVKGQFEPLVSVIKQLFPRSIDQLLYGFLYSLGIIPVELDKDPSDLKELMRKECYDYLMLDLLNQVALGKGIFDKPLDIDEPDRLIVSSENVQMLKDTLRKSGNNIFAKINANGENNISGYTFVTKQDGRRNRHICFLGYFPVDTPKYGIMVWMKRKEQLQDVVCDEWPELGEYVSDVCKRIADYLMKNESNQ